MKLFDNPILLTQKRLAHRAGVLAAVVIAALIGLSFLAGLVVYLATPSVFGFVSPQEAGKFFYGWTIGVEILVLVLGGFSRIARTLADDRKGGLWDSNRLTPLRPAEIVTGYWLGSALREFYMGVVLAGTGLVIVGLARLPLTLWLGTQILIFSTALFFGLLALLAGMAFQRSQGSIVLVVLFFPMFSFAFPRFTLLNFLLPVYGIASLFCDSNTVGYVYASFRDWGSWPELLALPVPPVLLTLGLQLAMGAFFWRAAVRKTANPFQPLLLRWEAIAVFALLVVVQHALIWGIWRGGWPTAAAVGHGYYGGGSMLPVVHGATLLAGLMILAFASPLPERVRIEALRTGSGNQRRVFDQSAVSLGLALVAVAAIASLTQFVFSFKDHGATWALAVANLLVFFLMFSLLLEFCRLRFKRRALGFVALWLFVFCLLPFILAGVFSNEALAKLSFLAPGAFALADAGGDDLKYLVWSSLLHLGIVLLLVVAWRRQWKVLLSTVPAVRPAG